MLEVSIIRSELEKFAVEKLRYQPTFEAIEHWQTSLDNPSELGVPGFDPLAAPRLLPYVYLLEKEDDRLKYRVSGEEVNRLFGSNHGGKYFDEVVPPEIYPEVAPYFFAVFDFKVCIFKGHVLLHDKEFMEFERVLLPVARRGALQLLGTLALGGSSALKIAENLPDPPGPGFHFTLFDLHSGESASRQDGVLNAPASPKFGTFGKVSANRSV
jgi:hypothetical protein